MDSLDLEMDETEWSAGLFCGAERVVIRVLENPDSEAGNCLSALLSPLLRAKGAPWVSCVLFKP